MALNDFPNFWRHSNDKSYKKVELDQVLMLCTWWFRTKISSETKIMRWKLVDWCRHYEVFIAMSSVLSKKICWGRKNAEKMLGNCWELGEPIWLNEPLNWISHFYRTCPDIRNSRLIKDHKYMFLYFLKNDVKNTLNGYPPVGQFRTKIGWKLWKNYKKWESLKWLFSTENKNFCRQLCVAEISVFA